MVETSHPQEKDYRGNPFLRDTSGFLKIRHFPKFGSVYLFTSDPPAAYLQSMLAASFNISTITKSNSSVGLLYLLSFTPFLNLQKHNPANNQQQISPLRKSTFLYFGFSRKQRKKQIQENTEMLLGDAKKTSDSLASMVKERLEKV